MQPRGVDLLANVVGVLDGVDYSDFGSLLVHEGARVCEYPHAMGDDFGCLVTEMSLQHKLSAVTLLLVEDVAEEGQFGLLKVKIVGPVLAVGGVPEHGRVEGDTHARVHSSILTALKQPHSNAYYYNLVISTLLASA